MENEKLSENINNLEKKLIDVRHNLHKHPELSNEEFETKIGRAHV